MTKLVLFKENICTLAKKNQYVTADDTIGKVIEHHDDAESHKDVTAGTESTSHSVPLENEFSDQNDDDLRRMEGGNMAQNDNLDEMASNVNVETQARLYRQRERKPPERFPINSIVRTHEDDDRTMRETLNCDDIVCWKEEMCTDLKALKT